MCDADQYVEHEKHVVKKRDERTSFDGSQIFSFYCNLCAAHRLRKRSGRHYTRDTHSRIRFMSLLIRRIVLVIAAVLLPMQSWAAALASDCAMTISADAPVHGCDESPHSLHGSMQASSSDQQSTDQSLIEQSSTAQPSTAEPLTDNKTIDKCLSGADCHCSALYQQIIPFALIPPIRVSAGEFIETDKHFVAVTHPPLWRPPIVI